jgi:hypothetical protein
VPEEEPDEPEELEEEPVPVPEDDGSAAPLGAVNALAPAGTLEAVPGWDAASVLELPEEHRTLGAASPLSSVPGKAELVAFRVAEHQMVIVFRHYARTEFCEPFQFVLNAITSQVEMDAVLHDLWLGYQLEEDPRLPVRRLDHDVGVVLRVEDALTAQPRELRLIVRSDLVTVEDGGPEPGDRRGMAAIKYNIVKASHGHIMLQPRPAATPARSSPRTHATISSLAWGGAGLWLAAIDLNRT